MHPAAFIPKLHCIIMILIGLMPCAVISIECMPEACVLVKGKPRVRMVPEKAAEADKSEQGAVAKEEALGSGTADPAADMFNAKVSHRHTSAFWCH